MSLGSDSRLRSGRQLLYSAVVGRVLLDGRHEVAVQRVAEAPLVLLGRDDGGALVPKVCLNRSSDPGWHLRL